MNNVAVLYGPAGIALCVWLFLVMILGWTVASRPHVLHTNHIWSWVFLFRSSFTWIFVAVVAAWTMIWVVPLSF
jgi:hypothetical protein